MERLIEFSLRRRALILVLIAGLAGVGVYAVRTVPIDAFPDVTPTLVQVFTSSQGLSPEDVETLISYPIETAMYGLPNLDRIQSTSLFGLSRVNIYFQDGTDIYFARRLVDERLSKAREAIPAGLGEPEMGPLTTGLGDVLMYRLQPDVGAFYTLMQLRTLQDWLVKPLLRTVPGVTEVLSTGGFERQYQVQLNMNALLARGVTIDDVRRALVANNRNVGASFLERGGEEYIIRGRGWVGSGEQGLEDIRNIVLRQRQGVPVYVRDVAKVALGPGVRRGAQVSNGVESVGGDILKLVGTDTIKLLGRLEEKIQAINRMLPEGLRVVPYYSQADLVHNAVGTVEKALLEGALLVFVVLYLFLGNLRSTLIVIATLPLSILIAFVAMRAIGMTANLMSLGGLAIGIGIMVDGAVVMVENIYHRLRRADAHGGQVQISAAVLAASREVASPVAFAMTIIVVVFLPLFTLQGVEGKLFSPMAYTIAFALGGALLLAMTLVPVLASLFIRSSGSADAEPPLVRFLERHYRPMLVQAMRYRSWVLAASAGLFAVGLALFPLLGSEFVPTLREGTFYVESALPSGANLNQSVEYARRIQQVFSQFPEVTGSYTRVGRAEVGGDPDPINTMATTITLRPLAAWSGKRSYEALQMALSERVEKSLPELSSNFSQPIQLRTDELISGIKAQVVISIYGDEFDQLQTLGEQITRLASQVKGAVDVALAQQTGKPQILVKPDRQALARYGVSVDAFLGVLETGVGGVVVGQVFEGTKHFDINLRLSEDERNRIAKIRALLIRTSTGAVLPLERLAGVDVFVGPKEISRNNASRRAVVTLNVRGRDMGGVVADIQAVVKREVSLPAGYYTEYGGQFENQQRAMQRLYLVVPITLGLIFLLLFFSFNSLRYAILIFLNVPFAVTGGILALWISGLYLSVPAAVGFIAVFGVAVLNGVVMVSYFNQLRQQGLAVDEAVRQGASRRLRPVLMTASVTILGLIPLLLADGIGANVQRPLAAVVVGGLCTSTLLTLVLLPVIYSWVEGRRTPQAKLKPGVRRENESGEENTTGV